MKISIKQKQNESLENDEITIELQYSTRNYDIQHFIDYIYNYEANCKNKVIVMNDDYAFIEIECEDIILFYSDKKNNYCQTKSGSYKVRSRLYELESMYNNFIRISKRCIININHIEKFDISETGKIVVKLDNSKEEIVSRRRTKNIMKYLEDRRI